MSQQQPVIKVGGLYAVQNEDGTFGIYKVLAFDWNFAVGLRRYSNKFETCPSQLDPSSLTYGMSMEDIQQHGINLSLMGIGHFPLTPDGFWEMNPVLVQVEPVIEEELDGHRVWLESGMSEDDEEYPAEPGGKQPGRKKWWQFWK